ncbi:MAG: hypothetical protein RLY93_02610 [Sumerlaeia bacterium]
MPPRLKVEEAILIVEGAIQNYLDEQEFYCAELQVEDEAYYQASLLSESLLLRLIGNDVISSEDDFVTDISEMRCFFAYDAESLGIRLDIDMRSRQFNDYSYPADDYQPILINSKVLVADARFFHYNMHPVSQENSPILTVDDRQEFKKASWGENINPIRLIEYKEEPVYETLRFWSSAEVQSLIRLEVNENQSGIEFSMKGSTSSFTADIALSFSMENNYLPLRYRSAITTFSDGGHEQLTVDYVWATHHGSPFLEGVDYEWVQKDFQEEILYSFKRKLTSRPLKLDRDQVLEKLTLEDFDMRPDTVVHDKLSGTIYELMISGLVENLAPSPQMIEKMVRQLDMDALTMEPEAELASPSPATIRVEAGKVEGEMAASSATPDSETPNVVRFLLAGGVFIAALTCMFFWYRRNEKAK